MMNKRGLRDHAKHILEAVAVDLTNSQAKQAETRMLSDTVRTF
jgi:hypothetical protein